MKIKSLLCLMLLSPLCLPAQDDAAIRDFEALIKGNQFSEARDRLEPYVAAHPQSWQPLYQLGYVDFRLHRIQESLALLCKSLVLNPRFADSHKILAYDLNILGHSDLALREIDRALAYNPESAENHYEAGRLYYEQGSYLKAIEHLEKAKSLEPADARAYHNLGLAYAAISEEAKARTNFELGLQINQQQSKPSAWPLIDYATYLNSKGEFAKARDMLLTAVDIDRRWDQAFDELAKSYRALGDTSGAVNALTQAITLNPRKAEYHYVLARLYTQGHQIDKAKEQLAEYERDKNQESK